MAKIKTSEHEDQLSVIAQLLIETDKNIKELGKATYEINENKELYKVYFENAIEHTVKTLNELTTLKMREMNQISTSIAKSHAEAMQQIKNSADETIKNVREMSEQKIKSSKQSFWFVASIGAVLAIATITLEVNRSIDKKTISEAVRVKAEADAWKVDLKQWMDQNPKDAKSFIEWYKKKSNR